MNKLIRQCHQPYAGQNAQEVRQLRHQQGTNLTCIKIQSLWLVERKKGVTVVAKKGSTDTLVDTDEDEGEPIIPVVKTHPSKNYSKIDLYDRWVDARTQKIEYRNQVTELQKETFKDQKELEKLYRDLSKEKELVEELRTKVEDVSHEVDESSEKKKSKKGAEKKAVSDTERIQNMRATFQNLTEKKEYEFKNVLCELQLNYDQLKLHLANKDEEIVRLKEDVNFYKKDHCHLKELKVATLKSEVQVTAMRDKVAIR